MTTSETQIPPLPEPLSRTAPSSPAVVRAHRFATEQHYAAKRAVEEQARRKAEAAKAQANAPLTEDQYFELGMARHNQNKARELAREVEALARQKEKEAYLSSKPERAEIMVTNSYDFLSQLEVWHSKKYKVDFEGPMTLNPLFFHIQLVPPTSGKAA